MLRMHAEQTALKRGSQVQPIILYSEYVTVLYKKEHANNDTKSVVASCRIAIKNNKSVREVSTRAIEMREVRGMMDSSQR
jgi:predicted transcriptional regulator